MAADIIDTFLTASTAERLLMARGPVNAQDLKDYFGEAAYGEYIKIADKLDVEHLSVTIRQISSLSPA